MPVFIVVSTRKNKAPSVAAAIQRENLKHYELKDDAWLVSYKGTTRELAELLRIREGETGPGIVCLIENYSGRLPRDAWEWLRVHEGENE
jgi:hypothetical protein